MRCSGRAPLTVPESRLLTETDRECALSTPRLLNNLPGEMRSGDSVISLPGPLCHQSDSHDFIFNFSTFTFGLFFFFFNSLKFQFQHFVFCLQMGYSNKGLLLLLNAQAYVQRWKKRNFNILSSLNSSNEILNFVFDRPYLWCSFISSSALRLISLKSEK